MSCNQLLTHPSTHVERERKEHKMSRLQAGQQPHQEGLALCHRVTLVNSAHCREGFPHTNLEISVGWLDNQRISSGNRTYTIVGSLWERRSTDVNSIGYSKSLSTVILFGQEHTEACSATHSLVYTVRGAKYERTGTGNMTIFENDLTQTKISEYPLQPRQVANATLFLSFV